jgi:hypothetical protein
VRVEREAGVGRLGERALEHVPRIGDGRLSVRRRQVAEHARGRIDLAAPGQRLERGRVGLREQVGLVGAGEPLDRRAVEPDALRESALDLGRGDRHGLESADHIGEPQPHELDAALLDGPQDKLLLAVHDGLFCRSTSMPRSAEEEAGKQFTNTVLSNWRRCWSLRAV